MLLLRRQGLPAKEPKGLSYLEEGRERREGEEERGKRKEGERERIKRGGRIRKEEREEQVWGMGDEEEKLIYKDQLTHVMVTGS